jgi:methionyl aminopeptidase
MIHLKTEKEIEIMRKGGEILKKVCSDLFPFVKAGMTTLEVDEQVQRLIKEYGGEISFNKVPNYFWATCITLNDQVVHTPPSKRVIKEGDVMTIDIGVFYKGYHVDYSDTFIVGDVKDKEIQAFLDTGKNALKKAIEKVQVGNYLGEVSQVIEEEVESKGYYVMSELTGHGVGKELHEDPLIPGYVDKPIKKTHKIEKGMVLAIEVIYSTGTTEIIPEKGDDWSLVTDDGSLSACFEHTVAVYKNRPFILT